MTALEKMLQGMGTDRSDVLLQPFEFSTSRQNQMLFFIKPEVFQLDRSGIQATAKLIGNCFTRFGIELAGGYMMSAETLKQRGIMDRHYGYINRVSRSASSFLSPEDKDTLRAMCGAGDDTPILGGHEVLQATPTLTAKSLDDLWASKKSQRLRSGLYAEAFDIDGTQSVVTNGFHPYQLEHFTGSGRHICLLLLNSDLPWSFLRSQLLGDTFPEKAVEGSIRGELYGSPSAYGFSTVSIANNGAHMSAGPFEAVFELQNFLSGVPGVAFDIAQLRETHHFASLGLAPSDLVGAAGNPSAEVPGGRQSSLFDATEECDGLSAAGLYEQFFRASN